MIRSVSSYFENLFNKTAINESVQPHTLELATAVLMIEISLADDHLHADERQTIKSLLHENFNLEADAITRLVEQAEAEVDHAVSLHEFTRLLNGSLGRVEKMKIIENLWQVAYADSVIDKYEEYFIRKIADLLYVPHSDYIKAKLNAAE